MTISDVSLIMLPKILDSRGNLSFFQNHEQIPFEIQRVYWIYDVPGGEHRGCHAYRELQEFIIALSGSFDIILNDGKNEIKYTLNHAYMGLYVPKMIWRQMENFSTNSIAFIAASMPYKESEYIRDFSEFRSIKQNE